MSGTARNGEQKDRKNSLAAGILMGRHRCTRHQAFELLRTASHHRDQPVREIAAQLVAEINGGPAGTRLRA